MSNAVSAPGSSRGAGEVSASAIRAQMAKIVRSTAFTGSERMCRFLRFVVEQTIAGKADQLKEYLVGVEVFDREPTYDSRVDPIVRVEARRLRAKLAQYYSTDGRHDEVLIELPKGRYAALFGKREVATGAVTAVEAASIALLPFVNLSADPENEYFSDGLTRELIHAMTKIPELRVVAWNTASRWKGTDYDVRATARQLNVAFVLEGSVRRSADRLRVTAQLVDAGDGRYLWSETYERELKDVFAIQDEIARAIALALKVRLVRTTPAMASAKNNSPEAYDLYLKGRAQFGTRTEEGLCLSIEYFEQAIAADAACATAWAGLADAWSLLAEYGMRPPSAMPRARSASMRALEIDPTLSEANVSLGFIRSMYDREWAEAETHYRRAIELNPGYVGARHWYAIDYLAVLGRFDEAFEQINVAVRLDPLSPVIITSKAYLLMLARRYEESIQIYRDLLESDCSFYRAFTGLGRVLGLAGQHEEAIAKLEFGQAMGGPVPTILSALGQIHAEAGHAAEARGLLEKLLEESQHRYVPSTCLALVHAGLGEKDAAFAWLTRGAEQRELSMSALKVNPVFDSLRDDERFSAMLRRVGLA